jgi:ankyrin repeat protein
LTVSVLLAEPQIDVNLVDGEGLSALISASKQGHPRTVKALLDHPDTDVNLEDNKGRTALSWASKNGHECIVDLIRASPRLKPGVGRRFGKRLDSAVVSMKGLWKK